MTHLRLLGVAALTGVLALSGWVMSMPVAFAQSTTLQRVKIRLDWKGGTQHAPFYLGKALGYYKEEGIDLEVIQGSGSSDTVKQVGTGAVEFGLVDALVLVQAAQQHVPAKSVAAYYQRTPIVMMSPKSNPVTDPKQLLKGVKIGSKKGSATFQGLVALLSANNIAMEQVNLVDIGFGVQPLLLKQVDAMMGFATSEPVQAENAGMPIYELSIADFGVDTYGLTIVSNPSLLKSKPELVKGFLKATERAVSEAIKNPAEAVAATLKQVDGLNADIETKTLTRTIPYWQSPETKEHGLGWQTVQRWQGTVNVAHKLGLIETDLKPDSVFENSFLPQSSAAK